MGGVGKRLLIFMEFHQQLLGDVYKRQDPDAPSLFQVANVDTGEIKTIHAAEVKEIVSTYEQEVKKRLESPTQTEQQF